MLIIDCKYRLTGKEQRYTPSSQNKTPHNKANGLAEETEDLLLEDSVTSKASLVQVEEPYIPKVGKPYSTKGRKTLHSRSGQIMADCINLSIATKALNQLKCV